MKSMHPNGDSAPHSERQHSQTQPSELEQQIQVREQRKIKAQREGERSAWFGLGMFGLVGWSVTVPALLGTALGVWIDARWPSQVSWTLTCLFAGVVFGCVNAWWWVSKESRGERDA